MIKILRNNVIVPVTVLFSILIIYIYYSSNEDSIQLGPLTWVNQGQNQSIILNSQNKVILGPGNIQLWGNYPYVYGDILQQNKYKRFLIDLRIEKESRQKFLRKGEDFPFVSHPEQWFTFQSLRGQHNNSLLGDILRRSLLPGAEGNQVKSGYDIPHTNYSWKPVEGQNSVLVNKKDQQIILGPGYITLWGQYPYIFGRMWVKSMHVYFVLDIEKNEIEEVSSPICIFEKYNLPANVLSFLRWEMVMGDWPGSEHARALLEEAMAPKAKSRLLEE